MFHSAKELDDAVMTVINAILENKNLRDGSLFGLEQDDFNHVLKFISDEKLVEPFHYGELLSGKVTVRAFSDTKLTVAGKVFLERVKRTHN